MANLSDGGVILVGIDEDSGGMLALNGITEENAESYTEAALISDVDKFFSRHREVSLDVVSASGKKLVVISVSGLDRYPVVSKRGITETKPNIHVKTLYYRPRTARPQTREATDSDMDEIFEDLLSIRIRDAKGLVARLGEDVQSLMEMEYEQFFEDME